MAQSYFLFDLCMHPAFHRRAQIAGNKAQLRFVLALCQILKNKRKAAYDEEHQMPK